MIVHYNLHIGWKGQMERAVDSDNTSRHNKDREDRAVETRQQGRRARTGQSGQDSQDRTARTGQPGQDSQVRTTRAGHLPRTARAGQQGQDCQNTQRGQNSRNMIEGIRWRSEQDKTA
jgi:hypothetical protein